MTVNGAQGLDAHRLETKVRTDRANVPAGESVHEVARGDVLPCGEDRSIAFRPRLEPRGGDDLEARPDNAQLDLGGRLQVPDPGGIAIRMPDVAVRSDVEEADEHRPGFAGASAGQAKLNDIAQSEAAPYRADQWIE
jgi:hypothetical protein